MRHDPSTIEVATVAAFMSEGYFERPPARMGRQYASELPAIKNALECHFGIGAIRGQASTAAGPRLLARLDVPHAEPELVTRAATAGILLQPASHCSLNPPLRPASLHGFPIRNDSMIDAGIKDLAQVLLD